MKPQLVKRLTPILILLLGACSYSFRSDVTAFHTLGIPSGQSVAIVPMNPDRIESLEFKSYAGLIATKLRQYGYKVTDGENPELIVGFDVKMNDGREKIESRPSTRGHFAHAWHLGYGRGWGYWGSFHGDPFYDTHDKLVARTVYHTELHLEIRKYEGDKLFEGRTEADARSNDLPKIMPLMVEAMFTEFPGPSGVTRPVVIKRDRGE